jgi:hypothetical protein
MPPREPTLKFTEVVTGRLHTKETGNCNITAISEKNKKFQAGNWFPD